MAGSTGIRRQDHPIGATGEAVSVFVVTGARPGPVLATIGAVHGDEYEGPLVLSALLRDIDPEGLAGRWIVVPAANGAAVAAGTRCTPSDRLNLARCFPGDENGSHTRQLAAILHAQVIAPADCVLDLHSGGVAIAGAFFAGYCDAPDGVGARARGVAEAFGAPVVWRHAYPGPGGRTMSSAASLGIPGVYVEATGGACPDPAVLAAYRRGVLRVMAYLGMLPDAALAREGAAIAPAPPRHVEGSGDLDTSGPAPGSGLCTCHISVLQTIAAGTLCFTISDLDGRILHEVRNATAGLVMFCRRSRWVEKGETLFALARWIDRAGQPRP